MVTYIKHIVWRFAKLEPENFKLLDVRYNVMKNLILGDCEHLIKFILFGNEETTESNNGCEGKVKKQKDIVIRHIPRDNLWPGELFLRDDDLNFYERKDDEKEDNKLEYNTLEDNEQIEPGNNVELAIYHCKGKISKLIMIFVLLITLINFILFIGRELKDTIVVAYLLEYYSRHATDCAGWMSSVSKAIPLLFKYNYGSFFNLKLIIFIQKNLITIFIQ
jgi:hypothetical protein